MMKDFSIIEKIKILLNLISSSHISLSTLVIGIIILTYVIICILFNKSINKIFTIIIVIIICGILMVKYNNVIFNMISKFFDCIFLALYFPNMAIYIGTLIISNGCFIYTLIIRRVKKGFKICNAICSIMLDIILVIIIDVCKSNNINISDTISTYKDSSLLVLFQLSNAIFVSFILINLFISAYYKLKIYDKDYPHMDEIIFDDKKK